MTDIAELGYKIDSSGLQEGTKALDENAAAAEKVSGATDRLERDYQALARTVERSSSVLGDRLGGALDRIGTGTGAVITELQSLNRTNAEILASLGALDGKLASTAGGLQTMGTASRAAATAETQVATASQQLEQQLAQQDARLRGVAERAMEWASANREANVSERALAEAARDAALGIDYKARALAGAGSEQDRMVARARALEEAESRVANEVRQAAAAAEAQQINLKQLLGQIDPTVGALNRLAAMEDRLERAHKAGLINPAVFDQYQTKIDGARASILNATGAQNGMGMSARQLQANLRMVPAQVTDITTSLISGQPAWMVAIQQGGQLKDAFGGIGPAARAVGGYMLGLINPVTLAGAALAAMAISAKQAEDQLFDFQKAQILSGQATSIGAAGFLELASSIDRLQGVSRGGAVAALTETARAGRYAGEQFEMVAAAAARMEASAGRSLSATVSAFDSIAKEPVEGLLKLNDAERFLTAAQLQRITILQEEGRSQEAANEAIQIYATHLDDVASRTEALMPGMSKGWRDIKDDIGGAWGALGNFTSAVVELAGEWGVLARLPRLSDMLGLGLVGGTLVKNLGLPSFTDALNGLATGMRGVPPLPKPIEEGAALDPQTARDLAAVSQERATAEQAAAEAINAQLAGLDRATAKEAARLKIIAQYNKLADNDARRFDGSMQRLIAKAEADIDKQFNRSEGRSRPNTEAESLAKAYQSLNDQMAQQIALYGDTSRVAATRYQIERGNLKGLRADLADVLIAQAAQLDAQSRQKDATQALTKLQSELNKQEKSGLAVAQERLRVLNEAKGEGVISDGDYNATLAKIVSAGPEAPKVTGVDALFGGSSGELAKLDQQRAALEEWYSGQLLRLDAFRQSEASVNAIYDEQALVDRQAYVDGLSQIDRARQNVMLATAEQGFASVTELMRTSFSEQSALYKAAFIVQKAAAIAQATLAIQTGIAEAAKNPWPVNLAAMASVAAATAGLVSNIAAVGMAHDGIDSVPTEGTWLLNKGERVLTAGTAAKMDATLDRIASSRAAGPGAGGNVYAPTININGDPDARTVALVEQRVNRGMQQNYDRISSELTTGQGRVGKGLRRGNNVSRRVT